MRNLVTELIDECAACNRCIRKRPIEGANRVAMVDGQMKVFVNHERCISCGSRIYACHHGVRDYVDDTERFLGDLQRGVAISLIAAPAYRMAEDGDRLLAWLRQLGVRNIYDVSLGADICTWAHIRPIEQAPQKR